MNEQISALLDDEIALEDAMHIITSVQMNRQAADSWSQYHLIGDAMRGNTAFSPNFKQSLMQKIDLEATVLSPSALLNKNSEVNESKVKRKLPATWSIAASFAAVTLVGWMVLHQQAQSTLVPIEVAQNVVNDIAQVNTTTVASSNSIPEEYLMAHQASVPSGSSYYIQTVGYSGQ